MDIDQLIKELPEGSYRWYPFEKDAKILYLSDESDINDSGYDYVVVKAGIIEKVCNPVDFLKEIKSVLVQTGTLLLVFENRLGIRYFCGDKDIYTKRTLASIEGFNRYTDESLKKMGGRLYSRNEIENILNSSGFENRCFYSVLPDIDYPQILLADDYKPNENLAGRLFPVYHNQSTVYMDERPLYDTLVRENMLKTMANGYVVECSLSKDLDKVRAKQVTVSMDRGQDNALATIIQNDGKVVKKAIFSEKADKAKQLYDNMVDLENHGVLMIHGEVKDNAYEMPYVDGEIGTDYFANLMFESKEKFIEAIESFYEIILNSSEHVSYEDIDWEHFSPDWYRRKTDDPNIYEWRDIAISEDADELGPILKKGYIDLVPLNVIFKNDQLYFFDQEFYVENLPAKVILHRSLDIIYSGRPEINKIWPREEAWEYFKFKKCQRLWDVFNYEYLKMLRNDELLAPYHKKVRLDWRTMANNRARMNYSEEQFDKCYRNIFKGIRSKKIYLFGSGRFCKRFIDKYGANYEIEGVLDNNPDKWGQTVEGLEIYNPEHVLSFDANSYRVIVCILDCEPILEQLERMGVKDYAVFNPSVEYQEERVLKIALDGTNEKKKYHVGYVAGVFDLFHIGHLNLLRRAKEQCDYLIVGVVSDEQVMQGKKTMPVIPFEERIEIVNSCKYVDEAVEIPYDHPDSEYAYRKYQFDAQFSGSDYVDDPNWLAVQTFLRQHDSDLVFFPYTESTSSTKIKGQIRK